MTAPETEKPLPSNEEVAKKSKTSAPQNERAQHVDPLTKTEKENARRFTHRGIAIAVISAMQKSNMTNDKISSRIGKSNKWLSKVISNLVRGDEKKVKLDDCAAILAACGYQLMLNADRVSTEEQNA